MPTLKWFSATPVSIINLSNLLLINIRTNTDILIIYITKRKRLNISILYIYH